MRFRIAPDHFELLCEAREEFNQSDDVSPELSELINRQFAQIFDAEVAQFLAEPVEDS